MVPQLLQPFAPAKTTETPGGRQLHGSPPDSPFQVIERGSGFITPVTSVTTVEDNKEGQSSVLVLGVWGTEPLCAQ